MILVFGQNGQVARALSRQMPDAKLIGRATLDLSQPDGIAEMIATAQPSAVINAAAYTAVDKAEEEEPLAHAINARAPEEMARACAKVGVPLVHISTDYVFDGAGDAPFKPDDATGPLGAYGRSKLAGEVAVRAAGGCAVILRTAAVFSADGANFVKTMLRLGQDRDRLNVVADQFIGPTPAEAIASACLSIAKQLSQDPRKAGTYHLTGAPVTTWAGFARAVFAASGQDVTVQDIPASDYPTPAQRPANSRLDCSSLQEQFGITQPDWNAALQGVVAQVMEDAQ